MLILLKLVLSLGDGLLGAWALQNGALEKWDEGSFLRRMTALQVIPAAALFVGLYLIGHQEMTSDVPSFYLPAAHSTVGIGSEPSARDWLIEALAGAPWSL